MGSTTSEQLHPNVNENFIKMTVFPAENILLATTSIQSQVELSKWASNLLKCSQIKNNSILLPQQFKIVSRAPCGQQSTLEIRFECFYMSFEDQMEGRKESDKHFQQAELWYLLLTLVEAAEAGNQLSTNLGDIKPSNLLLNKQGQIRVLTKLSKPAFVDSYDKQYPTSSLYSPQQLDSRRKGFKSNKSNYLLAESFAIGMTMLAAGTITTPSSLYNYQTNELNIVQFNKTIKYWEQFEFYSEIQKQKVVYSKKLKEIVCNMLKFEPQKRMCSLQVNKILQNYKQQIMTLQNFVIQDQFFKQGESKAKTKTHNLQSRRRSNMKESMHSSIVVPSFNNSHDVSFQLQIPNASSELYNTSQKKNMSRLSASSNKRKLSVTAYFPERQQPK